MDSDVYLAMGIVLAMLSITSIISAYSDGHRPRISFITLLVAVGCIIYAYATQPQGYTLEDVPLALIRVIGKF